MKAYRAICRALLAAALLWTATATAEAGLAARIEALRAGLSARPAESQDRNALLARQLLASLERRQDLQRARDDARKLAANSSRSGLAAPPEGLLAIDALRRDLQSIEGSLASAKVRAELLQQERTAAAKQLEAQAAALRRLEDAGTGGMPLAVARLEAQLAESSIAEIDLLLQLTGLQTRLALAHRQADLRRLARARTGTPVSKREIEALNASLDARLAKLQSHLSASAASRQTARARAQSESKAGASRAEAALEALANLDIDVGSSRVDLQACKLEYSIVSPK